MNTGELSYTEVIEVVEARATEDEMYNIMQGRVLSGWDVASIAPLQWTTRERNTGTDQVYQEHNVSLYMITFVLRNRPQVS